MGVPVGRPIQELGLEQAAVSHNIVTLIVTDSLSIVDDIPQNRASIE